MLVTQNIPEIVRSEECKMYSKVETKYNLCNYFACSIWAGGFLIGRSEQSPTSRAQPSFGGRTWAHPRTAAGYRAYRTMRNIKISEDGLTIDEEKLGFSV